MGNVDQIEPHVFYAAVFKRLNFSNEEIFLQHQNLIESYNLGVKITLQTLLVCLVPFLNHHVQRQICRQAGRHKELCLLNPEKGLKVRKSLKRDLNRGKSPKSRGGFF
ncbi:hypothetical protein AVEN_116221-1 [Araneus ventricosus]|uniref:Uncharacterized protein n=1 Tax=Araneus ventricosus TaxID=182803 RepID=A0A4Y2VI42_ARAVE|nr:hypothetical protein AVEN_116221-1 [Araneus ventricosus]